MYFESLMAVDLNNLESCSVAELVALVKQLLQWVERVETLKAENASLKEQLRASKRATALFSKGKPNPAPKKPGRRAGEGRLERRAMPVLDPVDIVDDIHVPLHSPDCPRCGASLEVVEQAASVGDTLPQPVRSIQRFRVEHGRCHVCNWTGRGRDKGLAAGQHGATTHRTGSNVMAQTLTLNYHLGWPLSKVPAQNLIAAEEAKNGRALGFTRDLKATLREVINVWQEYRRGTSELDAYGERGARIRQLRDHQLRGRRLKDTDDQRLLDGIGLPHDLGRVLSFLEHPQIEPTKNRAEPGLRGAVIARKVSHCPKNERGAQTYEALKSVTATLPPWGHSVVRALADLIQGRPMPTAVARQSITLTPTAMIIILNSDFKRMAGTGARQSGKGERLGFKCV